MACVHVAGSKGKGSTCVFIASILREAGCRVGLYTSPHLVDFRERIRILVPQQPGARSDAEFEGMIQREELTRLVERLRPCIKSRNKKSVYGPLSFFEVYTALAFVYFREQDVDYVVLETGLGGRLDATNAADSRVCVITPISYDHTDKLGSTLPEIAREKAGIIKGCSGKETFCISSPQEEQARQVIRRRCGETGARLFEVGKDIVYTERGEQFDIKGMNGEYAGLKIRLTGAHQRMNAAAAVGAVEAMRHFGAQAGPEAIARGLAAAGWPGRCEVIGRSPLVILDGAQNVASCRVLKMAIAENFSYRRLVLVVGISRDKDVAGICRELAEISSRVIVTRADNLRASVPGELAKYFGGAGVIVTESVPEARSRAYAQAGPDDAILVCGSLFVVGEFKYGRSATG